MDWTTLAYLAPSPLEEGVVVLQLCQRILYPIASERRKWLYETPSLPAVFTSDKSGAAGMYLILFRVTVAERTTERNA